MDSLPNKGKSFVDILGFHSSVRPDQKAYGFLDSKLNENSLTFAELDFYSNGLAKQIIECTRSHDRALLLFNSGLDFIIAFCACLKANVISVPSIPPRKNSKIDRLQGILTDASPSVIITTSVIKTRLEEIQDLPQELENVSYIDIDDYDPIEDRVVRKAALDDVAFLQYTSGSTSAPKGVMITHDNLVQNSEVIKQGFGHDTQSIGASWLPIYHDMGLIGGILQPLYVGFPCHLMDPVTFLQTPLNWLKVIDKYKVSSSGGPNFGYSRLVNIDDDQLPKDLDLSSWRVAFTGAEPIQASVMAAFSKKFAPYGFDARACYPCYGLAEATLFATGHQAFTELKTDTVNSNSLEKHIAEPIDSSNENHLSAIVSCGFPRCNHKIEIINASGDKCNEREVGEIHVFGASVAKGYWRNDKASAESFYESDKGRAFKTGDYGYLADGHLYICGRIKETIILNGRNISPLDIEYTVSTLSDAFEPNASACVASDVAENGLISENASKQIVVVQEIKRTYLKKSDHSQLAKIIKDQVWQHHEVMIDTVMFVKPMRIPRTTSGKIQRRKLASMVIDNSLDYLYASDKTKEKVELNEVKLDTSKGTHNNRESIQLRLLELLNKRTKELGKEYDLSQIMNYELSDLGLGSAQLVGLAADINDEFNADIDAVDLFAYTNVNKLTDALMSDFSVGGKNTSNIKYPSRTQQASYILGVAFQIGTTSNESELWDAIIGKSTLSNSLPDDRKQLHVSHQVPAYYLNSVDKFDPAFFNLSAKEAKFIDPQQRLLLKCSWWAIENAGLRLDDLKGSSTGVFVAINRSDYAAAMAREPLEPEIYHVTGNANSIAANRLSYFYDFTGPSVSIDTACSSGLMALHLAHESLQRGECEYALVAASSIYLDQHIADCFQNAGMFAGDAQCKTFSDDADGYVRGEGIIAVLLAKQPSSKPEDVSISILGSATNQDGRSNGITAPNQLAQAKVIQAALKNANCSANDIDYIEAHGSGTPLGDPIELTALSKVFGQRNVVSPCYVGTIKNTVGHLETAAGLAGLVKAIQVIKHRTAPKQTNITTINHRIDINSKQLSVPLTDVDINSASITCGISSFGFGGSNVHVIINGSQNTMDLGAAEIKDELELQLLSIQGQCPQSLLNNAVNYLDYLQSNRQDDWPAIASATRHYRSDMRYRIGVLAKNRIEAVDQLSTFIENSDPAALSSVKPSSQLAFVFTGQGSHYSHMGKQLYTELPLFKRYFDRCNHIIGQLGAGSLVPCLDDSAEKWSMDGVISQLYLFAIEFSLAASLRDFGIEPKVVIGHSLGEIVAATFADYISLESGLKLAYHRSRLMAKTIGKGKMLAVKASLEKVKSLMLSSIDIAAINSNTQIVLSGLSDDIEQQTHILQENNIESKLVNDNFAFHSRVMDEVLDDFQSSTKDIDYSNGRYAYLSSMTAMNMQKEDFSAEYWVKHLRSTVNFAAVVTEPSFNQIDTLIEIGPKPVLSQLIAINKKEKTITAFSTFNGKAEKEHRQFTHLLGALYQAGISLNIASSAQFLKIPLPNYSFAEKSLWFPVTDSSTDVNAGEKANNFIQREEHTELNVTALDKLLPSADKVDSHLVEQDVLVAVKGIFTQLLEISPAELDENRSLLEFGADSIILYQALQTIEQRWSVSFDVAEFFNGMDTVQAIVNYICSTAKPNTLTELALKETSQTATEQSLSLPPNKQAVKPAAATQSTSNATWAKSDYSDSDLTDKQSRYVNEFIETYLEKRSKNQYLARVNSTMVADIRSTMSFRHLTRRICFPIISERAEGAYIWDVDGNRYVDFTMGFGVNLFGHNPAFIKDALHQQLDKNIGLGPINDISIVCAEKIAKVTGMDRIAFCNSGTEAVMGAVRIARATTKREEIVIFNRSYHGHSDVTMASGAVKNGEKVVFPWTNGILQDTVKHVTVLEYGEPESLAYIKAHAQQLACILVEPIQNQRPYLQPREFLHELRQICDHSGALLIFDEMITGFRLRLGGAQEYFGVDADIATYGKVIGGGMPIGIIAGRSKMLDVIDGGNWSSNDYAIPNSDRIFTAGTFCRHPLSIAAANAVVDELISQGIDIQRKLERSAQRLAEELNQILSKSNVPIEVISGSSLFRFVPKNTKNIEIKQPFYLDLFFSHLISKGIYIWEGRSCFISTSHTEDDFRTLVNAVSATVVDMKQGGFFNENSTRIKVDSSKWRLTYAQRQLWLLSKRSNLQSQAYNQSIIVRVNASVNEDKLLQAIEATTSEADITQFAISDDGNYQYMGALLKPEVFTYHEDFVFSEGHLSDQETRYFQYHHNTPFDLEKESKFRFALVLGKTATSLMITGHHIFSDGISLGLMLKRIDECMSALESPSQLTTGLSKHTVVVEGIDSTQAVLPANNSEDILTSYDQIEKNYFTPFVDYLNRYDERIATTEYQHSVNYWAQQFQAPYQKMTLPLAKALAEVGQGGRQWKQLSRQQVITTICNQYKLTPFMFYLSAYIILLYRYTQSTCITIGVPTSLREKDNQLGYCTALLPYVFTLEKNTTVEMLFTSVKQKVLHGINHAFCELEDALSLAEKEYGLDDLNVIQATFNIDLARKTVFAGQNATLSTPELSSSAFPLTLNITSHAENQFAELIFQDQYFTDEIATSLLAVYEQITASMLADPSNRIDNIRLLSHQKESEQINQYCTGQAIAADTPLFLQEFSDTAKTYPDRTAITFAHKSMSYSELNSAADRLAQHILQQGSDEKNKAVGILLERSPNMIIAILACFKAGYAYLPLDPSFPKDRISLILDNANCHFIITDNSISDYDHAIPALNIDTISTQDNVIQPDSWRPLFPKANQLAYLIYTSGSTGKPKGVKISHDNLATFILSMRKAVELRADDRVLALTSISFDISIVELLMPLSIGASVVIADSVQRKQPEKILHLINENQVTIAQATPTSWGMLTQIDAEIPSNMKIISGGEPLTSALLRSLAGDDKTVINAYGPTETTVWSSVSYLDKNTDIVHVGKPLPGETVYILDEHQHLCPPGFIGEIYIGGRGVAIEYHERDELTEERFIQWENGQHKDRIYKTGDLGRWLDNDLHCLGRNDNQVKIRGHRIELEEIENILVAHPDVNDAIVVPNKQQQTLIAFVCSTIKNDAILHPDLHSYAKKYLSAAMIPSQYIILDSIPKTPNGKKDRNQLVNNIPQIERSNSVEEPSTHLSEKQKIIAKLWTDILGQPVLKPTDDFFIMGGHSIKALQFQEMLSRTNNLEFDVARMYEDGGATLAVVTSSIDWSSDDNASTNITELKEDAANDVVVAKKAVNSKRPPLTTKKIVTLLRFVSSYYLLQAPGIAAAYSYKLLKNRLPLLAKKIRSQVPRNLNRFFFFINGSKIHANGFSDWNRLAGRPVLLLCNHNSIFDTDIMKSVFPFYFNICQSDEDVLSKGHFKSEALKNNLYGPRFIHYKKDPFKTEEELKRMAAYLKEDNAMLFFPEGQFGNGQLLPFGGEPVRLAIEAGAVILPVALMNSSDIFEKHGIYQPSTIYMSVGEPIETTSYTPKDSQTLASQIRSKVEAMIKIHNGDQDRE